MAEAVGIIMMVETTREKAVLASEASVGVFSAAGLKHTVAANGLAVAVAVASGLVNILANMLYTAANSAGPTATVSATYPAITLVLARVFLKEPITANSAIGMAPTLATLPSKK